MSDLDWKDIAETLYALQAGQAAGSRAWAALEYAAVACKSRARHTRYSADEVTPVTRTPRVCVETPLRAAVGDNVTRYRNQKYADAAMFDSLMRNEAPFLGHLLYPRVLNDDNEADRAHGISAHKAWLRGSERVAVYVDYGISEGMQSAIELARELGIEVTERALGPDWIKWAECIRGTAGFERKDL